MDDLLKKSIVLQDKISRYEKLLKTRKRTAKQNTYEKELTKALDDFENLEKKIKTEGKKLQQAKKEIQKSKKMVNDLKHVYCGARKPRKGQRKGTIEECRTKGQIRMYGLNKVADKSGGNIDKKLVHEILDKAMVKRPVVRRKGGKLAVGVLKKFIQESHKEGYHDVGDYKVDRELSHEWVKVYYNAGKNQAVVVHRGSSDMADAWTDTKLLFQQKDNKRFKVSEKVQKEAEKKYGSNNVTTVGSSLGGYLAEEYGKNSKEVISISKPTTPLDVFKGKKKGKNQFDIRTTRDPIAMLQNLQKGSKDIVIPSKSLNPFKEHMGDSVLSNLDPNRMIGKGELNLSVLSDVAGLPSLDKLLKGMKVKELKELVKLMRNMKRGRARQYPVTGTKKCDLCKMVSELSGGNLPQQKQENLWEKLNVMFSDKVAIPLFKYLIKNM